MKRAYENVARTYSTTWHAAKLLYENVAAAQLADVAAGNTLFV
jgi:hypothetical protein